MPSIYIAAVNSAKAIPAFSQKGVPKQAPGIVGEIPISISAPFFALPSRAFLYIINAIATNSIVQAAGNLYFNAFRPIKTLNHVFNAPTVSIKFANLTPAEVLELKGMGLQQDVAAKGLFFGSPPSHFLQRINELGPLAGNGRPGYLNFDAFIAWVYLMKGLHIYTTCKNIMTKNSFSVAVSGSLLEKSGQIQGVDGSDHSFVNPGTKKYGHYDGAMVFAPGKENLSHFPGSVVDINDDFTFGNGIFFPYFLGMNHADKHTSYQVFKRIFDGALADDAVTNMALMDKIRSGARSLGFSQTGIVLSHIYKCIGLAEEICGAKVHVMVKGSVYVGTVIEGEFKARLYSDAEVTSDSVVEDIASINLIESQADSIVAILNAVEDSFGNKPYSFVRADFIKSRVALHSFLSVDQTLFHSTDSISKVKDILMAMEFNDIFSDVTSDTFSKFVSFLSTGEYSHISDMPAYLGGGVLDHGTRTWEGMSMFGPRGPTVNHGGNKGKMIVFPALDKEDTNLVRVAGVRPLAYFPVVVKPAGKAVEEWDAMISSGKMMIPHARKGKTEFTNTNGVKLSLGSDPVFSRVYDQVKGMVNEARKASAESGKRKRDVDAEDGRGAKRSKRAAGAFSNAF